MDADWRCYILAKLVYEDVIMVLCSSLLKLMGHLPDNMDVIVTLPPTLKDRILQLMSKRGLITDNNLSQVIHDKVRILDLSECDVSDAALHTVASKCPMLRKIDLNSAKESRTTVTSQGVVHLADRCRHLQVVYMRRCLNLTDAAVVRLSQCCPQLRDLNIGGCPQLTDVSLQALGENSKFLRSINFSDANVTDDGVFALCNGPVSHSLKEVHMSRCVRLTDEAVEAIVQFCPNISILLFHGCPNFTDRSREALEDLSANHSSKMKQVTWTVY